MRVLASWALLLVWLPPAALAEDAVAQPSQPHLCNRTEYVLDIAVGVVAGETIESSGWSRSYPGRCLPLREKETSLHNIGAKDYFFLAQSDRHYQENVIRYVGDRYFCVKIGSEQEGFVYKGITEASCKSEGGEMRGFNAIAPTSSGVQRIALVDAKRMSLKKARSSALQRLLSMAGFYDQAIDGFIGTATVSAMRDFAKTVNFNLSNPYDAPTELFDRLIDYASSVREKSGLAICNSTKDSVWLAIGSETKSKTEVRGWIWLDSNDCESVLNSIEPNQKVFMHAETAASARVERLWSGSRRMCTRRTKFVFLGRGDCGRPGHRLVGFRSIEINLGEKTLYSLDYSNTDAP